MITGKQLRDARIKKNISATNLAKLAGINVNTLYLWENAKELKPRNKAALGRLLKALGFTHEETLKASLPKKAGAAPKKVKKTTHATPKPSPVTAAPPAASSIKIEPAEVARLAQMLGFFMGDPARRSNLLELLTTCVRLGLTIHGLLAALEGASPAKINALTGGA